MPQILSAIDAANPAAGSAAADLRDRLREGRAVERLRNEVQAYLDETKRRFSDGANRQTAIAELMETAIELRSRMLRDPTLAALDDTLVAGSRSKLLPLPAVP